MSWMLRLALRNATRNVRRSSLTAATVLLGTALLVAGISWLNGIVSENLASIARVVGQVRVITPEYQVKEQLMPLHHNIAPSAPVVEAIEKHPGLRAFPVIRTGAAITVDEEIGENFGPVVGAPSEYWTSVLHFDEKVRAGAWTDDPEAVFLGQALASDLGAKPGDEVVLLGQTQDGSISPVKGVLAAVISTGNVVSDRSAFISLEKARWMADIEEGAIEIAVFGDLEEGDAAGYADALRADPALKGLVVQAWSERDPFNTIASVMSAVFSIVSGTVVLVAALGVLNTMLMSVLERTNEIGVLRAMGMSGAGAVLLFVVEAVGIGAVGSAIGVVLGSAAGLYLEDHGVRLGEDVAGKVNIPMPEVLHGHWTPQIALLAFALGLLTAVLGALIPSIRAAAIQPVDALRSKR